MFIQFCGNIAIGKAMVVSFLKFCVDFILELVRFRLHSASFLLPRAVSDVTIFLLPTTSHTILATVLRFRVGTRTNFLLFSRTTCLGATSFVRPFRPFSVDWWMRWKSGWKKWRT